MEPDKRKITLLAGLLVIIIFVVAATFVSLSKNKVDVLPSEGSSINFSAQARILDSGELLKALGGTVQFDSLSKDLFVFARKNYPEYKDDKKVVGFRIISDLLREQDAVVFSGQFGSVKNVINIRVQKLANSRIKTNISDSKTGLNIDSDLPSNTKRNQVISELPLETDIYHISYDKTGDAFVINIYGGAAAELDKAATDLAQKLGLKDLGEEKYSLVRSGGGLTSQPTVDNQASGSYE